MSFFKRKKAKGTRKRFLGKKRFLREEKLKRYGDFTDELA